MKYRAALDGTILCNESTRCIYPDALIAISLHSYPADVMGRTEAKQGWKFCSGKGVGSGLKEMGGWVRQGEKERPMENERARPEDDEGNRGKGTDREFNSMVDYATSLPDYCRYTLPFCADEGITLRISCVEVFICERMHGHRVCGLYFSSN